MYCNIILFKLITFFPHNEKVRVWGKCGWISWENIIKNIIIYIIKCYTNIFTPKSKETKKKLHFAWREWYLFNESDHYQFCIVALFYLKLTTFPLHNEKEREKVNVDESHEEILYKYYNIPYIIKYYTCFLTQNLLGVGQLPFLHCDIILINHSPPYIIHKFQWNTCCKPNIHGFLERCMHFYVSQRLFFSHICKAL